MFFVYLFFFHLFEHEIASAVQNMLSVFILLFMLFILSATGRSNGSLRCAAVDVVGDIVEFVDHHWAGRLLLVHLSYLLLYLRPLDVRLVLSSVHPLASKVLLQL